MHVAFDEAFVLGTDKDYSVEEFLQILFSYVGLDWRDYVEVDPRHLCPTELSDLRANPSKARKMLGWSPKIRLYDTALCTFLPDVSNLDFHYDSSSILSSRIHSITAQWTMLRSMPDPHSCLLLRVPPL